jgi:hypothetical protein
MKNYFFIFFFLIACEINSQSCENFEAADLDKTRKTEKKFSGSDKIKKVTGTEAFDVAADLMSSKNDLYKKWFAYAIDEFKKEYSREKKVEFKAEKLFKIGVCYFYLDDYLQAEAYLQKSVKAKYSSRCNLFFLYLCGLKLGRNEEAEQWRKQFDEAK